jgi:glycyl-tRNA synthetase beta chain
VLSIGDKADTIAGMFALGLVPSGSKDPFALRRQANAIVKVRLRKRSCRSVGRLMRDARAGYQRSDAERKFVRCEVLQIRCQTFFRERLEFYLKDVLGYANDVVKAVLAADADDVVDAVHRAEAVKQVLHLPEFQAIGAACKRMRNILKQAGEKGIPVAATFESLPEDRTRREEFGCLRRGERTEG